METTIPVLVMLNRYYGISDKLIRSAYSGDDSFPEIYCCSPEKSIRCSIVRRFWSSKVKGIPNIYLFYGSGFAACCEPFLLFLVSNYDGHEGERHNDVQEVADEKCVLLGVVDLRICHVDVGCFCDIDYSLFCPLTVNYAKAIERVCVYVYNGMERTMYRFIAEDRNIDEPDIEAELK